ncbi:MAG: RDD family protein [Nitrosomonas sp.]|nr:RDD family protein [Nitrosomonas sp.]
MDPLNETKESKRKYSLAPRAERLVANLVDSILVVFATFCVISLALSAKEPGSELSSSYNIVLIPFFCFVALNGYLLGKSGTTIGKLVLHLKIVCANTEDKPPLWRLLFLRYAPMHLANLFGILGLANVLMIFREDHRCGHDFIAGTLVVKNIDDTHSK